MSQATHRLRCVLTALLAGGAGFALPALAGDKLGPEIPAAKGEACVEPTDVMRRNHFEYILHQRDKTMHQGIRTKQYSLTECISCHIQPGPDGELPVAGEPDHFCSSCHTYAAVQIDCFQCHADQPMPAAARHDDDRAQHSHSKLNGNSAGTREGS